MILSRLVYLAGASPFLLLGTAHAFATPLALGSRKGLTPRDPALGAAMAGSGLLLTSRTDVWRCWVGFNLSHSLGAVLFGGFVLLIGWSEAGYAIVAPIAIPFATLVAAAYLAIGLKYWFRTPVIGISFGLFCFVVAWGLLSTGR